MALTASVPEALYFIISVSRLLVFKLSGFPHKCGRSTTARCESAVQHLLEITEIGTSVFYLTASFMNRALHVLVLNEIRACGLQYL